MPISIKIAEQGKLTREIRRIMKKRFNTAAIWLHSNWWKVLVVTQSRSMLATGEARAGIRKDFVRSGNRVYAVIVWTDEHLPDSRLFYMESDQAKNEPHRHISQHYKRDSRGRFTNRPKCSKSTFKGNYKVNPQARKQALKSACMDVLGIALDLSSWTSPEQHIIIPSRNLVPIESKLSRIMNE